MTKFTLHASLLPQGFSVRKIGGATTDVKDAGTCNIALLSYVKVPFGASSWFEVSIAGSNMVPACLAVSEGGATVINSM